MKVFEIIINAIALATFCAAAIETDRCALIPDGIFIGDPQSCDGWLRCSNGISTPGKCPEGLRFDATKGVCDLEERVPCKDDVCNEDNEGDFEADKREPRRCPAYFYCNNGIAESYDCPDGLFFDEDRKVCDYKQNVPNCQDTSGGEVNKCANVPNGVLLTDESDCANYFECKDFVAIAKTCEPNTLFDKKLGKCEDAEKVDCKIVCNEDDELKLKRNPKSCRSYYECKNKKAILKPCKPYEMVQEVEETPTDEGEEKKKTLKCVSQMLVNTDICANRCDLRPKGFTPAYAAAEADRCKKYHACKDGKILNVDPFDCPDSKFFNDETQKCGAEAGIDKETCRNKVVL